MEQPLSFVPFACALDPEDLSARCDELLPGLVARALAREDVESGYRYQFAPDAEMLTSIARVIDEERLCCPFFRFELAVEPERGPIVLTVTGPEGVREFIDGLGHTTNG